MCPHTAQHKCPHTAYMYYAYVCCRCMENSHAPARSPLAKSAKGRCSSVYLLYWYNRTNTEADNITDSQPPQPLRLLPLLEASNQKVFFFLNSEIFCFKTKSSDSKTLRTTKKCAYTWISAPQALHRLSRLEARGKLCISEKLCVHLNLLNHTWISAPQALHLLSRLEACQLRRNTLRSSDSNTLRSCL